MAVLALHPRPVVAPPGPLGPLGPLAAPGRQRDGAKGQSWAESEDKDSGLTVT